MKEVRRKYILKAEGNMRAQKALAFAMMLKMRLGKQSTIKDYSINKLRKIMDCSPTTAKKYIHILIETGFVTFIGKGGNVLVMRTLRSRTRHSNISVDGLCFDTLKDANRSVQSLIFMLRQASKDFIKRLVRAVNSPKQGVDFKKVRRLCKKYAWKNPLTFKYEYREWGLPLRKLAKRLGCCVATVQRIIKYAIAKSWVQKHKNFAQTYMKGVWKRLIEGFTFTTRNNGYNIFPNTYTLSEHWERNLVCTLHGIY